MFANATITSIKTLTESALFSSSLIICPSSKHHLTTMSDNILNLFYVLTPAALVTLVYLLHCCAPKSPAYPFLSYHDHDLPPEPQQYEYSFDPADIRDETDMSCLTYQFGSTSDPYTHVRQSVRQEYHWKRIDWEQARAKSQQEEELAQQQRKRAAEQAKMMKQRKEEAARHEELASAARRAQFTAPPRAATTQPPGVLTSPSDTRILERSSRRMLMQIERGTLDIQGDSWTGRS